MASPERLLRRRQRSFGGTIIYSFFKMAPAPLLFIEK
jgi:hypothetical protein